MEEIQVLVGRLAVQSAVHKEDRNPEIPEIVAAADNPVASGLGSGEVVVVRLEGQGPV